MQNIKKQSSQLVSDSGRFLLSNHFLFFFSFFFNSCHTQTWLVSELLLTENTFFQLSGDGGLTSTIGSKNWEPWFQNQTIREFCNLSFGFFFPLVFLVTTINTISHVPASLNCSKTSAKKKKKIPALFRSAGQLTLTVDPCLLNPPQRHALE